MRVIVAGCLLVACAPTETGNPVTVALSAHTSDPEIASFEGNGVRIESAWTGIGDIGFVLSSVCDDLGDTEVDIPGPSVVDLADVPLTREVDPSMMNYCQVRVPIEPVEVLPPTAPPELANHAILISGTTAGGTPFRLRTEEDYELIVRTRGVPFVIEGALVLSFDIARWFDGVDLDAGVVDLEGVIVVEDDINSTLLDAFEERVEDALELYDDEDEDGRRDDGEDRLADSDG